MFETLSNEKLATAYQKAIELKLDEDFIELLKKEMINRDLEIIR
ncbi:sporulation histidine kinase inhibitor Sda [Aquibacillus rhizosphaerae]|uniref:Sporulation histidine kinase inhibitor Sda n=1 Tax=Aquibacillus rhizosphaerae TaxID=3051431 RepID=A0ABT7L7F9_9BACI|nr:sporulation histidine kinase inhibitor Sda [Aquibacillus sp. LR5S19]MDL4841800.1 sporulation histidine kinase inhibitor Sda [Aquibacillus sp. LR5S19]